MSFVQAVLLGFLLSLFLLNADAPIQAIFQLYLLSEEKPSMSCHAQSVFQESFAMCIYMSVMQFSVKCNKDLQSLFLFHQNFQSMERS